MTTHAELHLRGRGGFDAHALIAFLGARAAPGVESFDGSSYRRTLELDRGEAVIELTPQGDSVLCRLQLDDPADRADAERLCRRLLDLDTDLDEIEAQLGADPVLGPLVRRRRGLRVPGTVDGFELAVRAIVGQQVSVAGARTVIGRLAVSLGERRAGANGLTHRFPSPVALAKADPGSFPFPRVRGEALLSVARLVLDARLDLDRGADAAAARAELLGVRGIGPWTASYIAMRALGDTDAWLPGDVGLRNALERLGQPAGGAAAERLAQGWRPWRSYGVMHLWATLSLPHPYGSVAP